MRHRNSNSALSMRAIEWGMSGRACLQEAPFPTTPIAQRQQGNKKGACQSPAAQGVGICEASCDGVLVQVSEGPPGTCLVSISMQVLHNGFVVRHCRALCSLSFCPISIGVGLLTSINPHLCNRPRCMLYQKCIKCIGSKRWKKKRKKKNLKPSQDPNWRNSL